MIEWTHHWYVWLALAALVAAWVYVRQRRAAYDWLAENLGSLEEDDRLEALQLVFGPIPESLSAEQWIKGKKHQLLFLGYLVTAVVLFPFIPNLFVPKPLESMGEFLGVTAVEEKTNSASNDGQPAAGVPPNQAGESELDPGIERKETGSEADQRRQLRGEGDGTIERASNPGGVPPVAIGARAKTPPTVSGVQEADSSPPMRTGTPGSRLVRSNRGGTVSKVHVQSGQEVKRGQVIAELECDDLLDQLTAAREESHRKGLELKALKDADTRELVIADLGVREAQASLQRVSNREKTVLALREKGIATQEQVADAANDLELAKTRLSLAEERKSLLSLNANARQQRTVSDASNSRAKLRSLEARLARCRIEAPEDGVLEWIVETGEYAGGNEGRPVASVKPVRREAL